jgi:hypothetical protein
MNDLKGAKFWLNLFLAVTDVKKGGNRVDILINSDRIKECKGDGICPYTQSDVGNKRSNEIEAKPIKRELKRSNNRKNAV